ncbi:MAG: DUF1570 domain-containing protein [Pirellulales bacterium]|nr:DUF1570 domain-containing protein [Pirellulales bacterium]
MEALILAVLSFLAPAENWGIARSENFVVNGPSREYAAEVLEQAEIYRRELALAWLGEELPLGEGPAIIQVRLSDEKDEAITWPINSRSREHHLVWITSKSELALGSTLAHEITHVVLATRFGDAFPHWANEGIASICDDERTKKIRSRLIREYAKTGRWPKLRDVLIAENISPTNQHAYTVSVSLTRYLLSRGTHADFVAFAQRGIQSSWDRAAQECYGFSSVEQLAAAWQSWAAQNPDAELEPVLLPAAR